MIFLAGVGSEEENNGSILHKGDVLEQCRYAYQKIKKVLVRHECGASSSHVRQREPTRLARDVG